MSHQDMVVSILREQIPGFREVWDTEDTNNIAKFVKTFIGYLPKVEGSAVAYFLNNICEKAPMTPGDFCDGCSYYRKDGDRLGCNHPKHPGMILLMKRYELANIDNVVEGL